MKLQYFCSQILWPVPNCISFFFKWPLCHWKHFLCLIIFLKFEVSQKQNITVIVSVQLDKKTETGKKPVFLANPTHVLRLKTFLFLRIYASLGQFGACIVAEHNSPRVSNCCKPAGKMWNSALTAAGTDGLKFNPWLPLNRCTSGTIARHAATWQQLRSLIAQVCMVSHIYVTASIECNRENAWKIILTAFHDTFLSTQSSCANRIASKCLLFVKSNNLQRIPFTSRNWCQKAF